MATAPSATPQPRARGGPGCLFVAIALPVVVLLGIVVGTMLDTPDEPPEEEHVTVASGTVGSVEWRLDAVKDIDGQLCAFLYRDGAQYGGGCSDEPDDATFGQETVVFGRVEGAPARVRVVLSNAEVVEIDTLTASGFEGRWYAAVVDGDVDVEKVELP